MNDVKTACVESRRNAILPMIEGKGEAIKQMVDNFFKRLEKFADECSDVTDFETKFATSELATEYAELFTTVMNDGSEEPEEKSIGQEVAEELKDDVTHAVKRQARQEAYDKARDIPGVGEALEVKQYADFFGRFRRKKDDE